MQMNRILNMGARLLTAAIVTMFLVTGSFGSWTGISHAAVSDNTKERLLRDAEYIGSVYREYYAPKDWKQTFVKWDLEQELANLKSRVQASQTQWDYRDGLVQFLKSMADYHVGFAFYSTEKSSLPFGVRTVEGKTLIVHIDRTAVSQEAFPFSEGDELLEMDQTPVASILKQLQREMGRNVEITDAALSDLRLTARTGRRNNYQVPRGPVVLKIKKAANAEVRTHQLIWNYQPEQIPDQDRARLSPFRNHLMNLTGSRGQLLAPQMYSPVALSFDPQANLHGMGAKKSFVPDFGARIWEAPADNTFDAYIFMNEAGKLIGVVRIPTYVPGDYNKASLDFKTILKKFSAQASGLIIDQLNNGGGSVYYLYGLIAMLTDQALSTPKHRVTISHSLVMEAHTTLEKLKNVTDDASAKKALESELHGHNGTLQVAQFIREYSLFIIEQWKLGKTLSEPVQLGIDFINPHPEVQFTKPIVVMVNELDFSGGDFFPAILQDNKRAVIVGTRTSGAGGYVNEVKIDSKFGFEVITFTGSIAERVNKQPIENLGITPDHVIPMTLQDYRGGFQDYKKSILNVMNGLVNK